ncbi:sporulation membrane protein YtaF [Lysinibacillus pakistanensis]|uniref:Sporulation membrane protein YtaF n=1 Tax=Lysinibacillus pakistanensis TaxID=759811 RepID=A0AAX3X0N6_9BACI|nr:sporulation membrane protein YtaF [Lysinibacillus pakistanensis]MDM5233098.1 sporulation membrane protein YtaF [Lysinibacillus pakistanensis]WHY48582.1 sporulation membrane protein YtaF [Lysinibacillus pakistanensis]WHY53595.1 sporulation membrane protein YtaF [Lysinibacillus pakistanensis]
MNWLIILAFTFSSSIDNLGVGLSYGFRKINVAFGKNLLIAIICFLMSMGGITFGVWLSTILPGMLPVIIGALLLFIIGIRIILLAKPQNEMDSNNEMQPKNVQDILRNPEEAHFKKSGEIGWGESVLLGVALSANALTNGVGAGLLGLSPLIISITAAIGSFITVWMGVKLGSKVADVRVGTFTVGQFGTIISGVILLIIAFLAFF